jgi:alpha-L-rhamnosidase
VTRRKTATADRNHPPPQAAQDRSGPPADPSRVDSYPLTAAKVIVNSLVQGGERFERITLTKPGSVTISRVGVRSAHAKAADFTAGSFTSSDPELNQIWRLGTATLALDSLPAGVLPPVWKVSAAGTQIPYSSADYYQYGGGWGDYTETFAGQLERGELSWAVRGGLGLTLTAADDTISKPDSLLVAVPGGFGAPPTVTAYPLPKGTVVRPGTWYTGSVGFSNAESAVAQVRDLSVVSRAGKVLYRSAMTSARVLGDFDAGSNPVSVIVDGGKRDRLVWGGDLLQAAPAVYYTSRSASLIRGSLELFGSYRTSQGEISSDVPVASELGVRPVTSLPGFGGFYSLAYSADWLLNLVNASASGRPRPATPGS